MFNNANVFASIYMLGGDRVQERELRNGRTVIGPHTDDCNVEYSSCRLILIAV